MSLTDKIKTVHKFDDDKMIVEFNNSFGVAYEKSEHGVEREVIDADGCVTGIEHKTIPSISYRELCPELAKVTGAKDLYNRRDFGFRNKAIFSNEMEQLLQTPRTDAQKRVLELEKTITENYDALVQPLKIEQYKCREWKEVLSCIGFVTAMTVAWPFTTAYMMLGGMKNDTSGDVSLALLTAPLALPQVLYHGTKELIWPSREATRICNKKALSRNCGKENAYLYFPYDEKATPSKFTTLEIVLPDNTRLYRSKISVHEIRNNGSSTYPGKTNHVFSKKEERKSSIYENNRWYFKADKQVCEEISRAVDERDKIQSAYQDFFKDVTNKDQIQMLKKLHFL